jgi:peptidoglycan/LPS O-acetylase OafA/YrhL
MFVVFGFFLGFMAYFGKHVPYAWIYPASYVVILVLSVLLGHIVSRWFSEPSNRRLRALMAARRPVGPAAPAELGA